MTNPPEGTPQICPYLYYKDVKAAIDWLTKSFGFNLKGSRRGPDGSIFHAEIQFGTGVVFLGPGIDQFGTKGVENPMGVHASVHIFVNEIDKHFANAKASGARIMAEIMEMPWGEKLYVASDLEGQRWIFAEHVRS